MLRVSAQIRDDCRDASFGRASIERAGADRARLQTFLPCVDAREGPDQPEFQGTAGRTYRISVKSSGS